MDGQCLFPREREKAATVAGFALGCQGLRRGAGPLLAAEWLWGASDHRPRQGFHPSKWVRHWEVGTAWIGSALPLTLPCARDTITSSSSGEPWKLHREG